MTIAKTLTLADLAFVALDVGTAMADGPDGLKPDLRFARTLTVAMHAARNTNHASGIQSGSRSILGRHMFGDEGLGG